MHPIASQLLDWYQTNARDLPWRQSQDPYAIWVSEVMLQQTRVETVIPYYQRWMERFPDLEELAKADLDEVLSLWEGLGYYRRARYLYKAAQQVATERNGQLPAEPRVLRELPGVGEYTAAAIGAFAFNSQEIALDGNLKRVLARLFEIDLNIQTSEATRVLRRQGELILPAGRAADFNQALMDLGAALCRPQNPKCALCPLAEDCLANLHGTQNELPNRRVKGKVPQVERVAAVVSKGKKLLLGRRPPDGLLADLWEFPGFNVNSPEGPQAQLSRWLKQEIGLQTNHWRLQGTYRHAYSHFKVIVRAYRGLWLSGKPSSKAHTDFRWAPLDELDQYPMGKVDRSIAESIAETHHH